MSDLLWRKSGQHGPDQQIMDFLAGEDVVLDRHLVLFDIQASAAHANGLESIGILDEAENARLQDALVDISNDVQQGKLVLDARFEDGHSAIETWLTERLGSLGAKIHTGRSRNDQVAVAMRLYLVHSLDKLAATGARIARQLLERAEGEAFLPIPGHTHLQKAMPSSAGLWLAGHAEAYIDNVEMAQAIRGVINASPLGTASGFGINLPLQRDSVAKELGFDRIVINPQYAQNARGKVELMALSAVSAMTLDLRRLSWDLSLFCSDEFGYITLDDRYCTGSSIMPNKHNPDTVELLRASHAVVTGAIAELNELLSLPSGYHRDLQSSKPPVMRAFAKALESLRLIPDLVSSFCWNEQRLLDSIDAELFATDLATRMAAEGKPFREAYREVGEALGDVQPEMLAKVLESRVSPGASGHLLLERLGQRLNKLHPIEK